MKIPQEYFQVFRFFKQQPKNTRIANFPQQTYWGWAKYQWGYSGSGFLWYGIEQPILDRAFDVWSDKNENYYWEISYALYSKNLALFEKVLEKYQINWLLVDGNIINPSSPNALYFDELGEMISKSAKISLAQEFNKIKIYQVNLETPVKDFVFLTENLPQIEPKYNWNNYDQAFLDNRNYSSLIGNWKSEIGNLTYYPFRSLFTGRSQEDLEFRIEEKEDFFILKNTVPKEFKDFKLVVSNEENKELAWVDPNDLSQVKYLKTEVNFDGNSFEVKVPKTKGLYSADIKPVDYPEVLIPNDFNPSDNGKVSNERVLLDGSQYLRLKSLDTKNCSPIFSFPSLTHQYSYLISVESRNLGGKSLLFWIENHNSRKPDVETHLPKNEDFVTSYFIQPLMEEDGLGYTLHFDSISIGNEKTTNDLGEITVYPFPFKFLTSLKLVNPEAQPTTTKLYEPVEVSHPNPSYYVIHQSPITDCEATSSAYHGSQVLVLSQAYHQGWLAWQVEKNLLEIGNWKLEIPKISVLGHVLINNWENGWIIEEIDTPVYILFWPQLLEYFGFFLLLAILARIGVYCLKIK